MESAQGEHECHQGDARVSLEINTNTVATDAASNLSPTEPSTSHALAEVQQMLQRIWQLAVHGQIRAPRTARSLTSTWPPLWLAAPAIRFFSRPVSRRLPRRRSSHRPSCRC